MKIRACPSNYPWRVLLRSTLLLVAISLGWSAVAAQSANQPTPSLPGGAGILPANLSTTRGQDARAAIADESANSVEKPNDDSSTDAPKTAASQFRVERLSLARGAELLTIFGRLDGMREEKAAPEVPLLSVVRDTLGDDNPENDRLRYVWMLTYTKPTLMKRIASAIPFLYQRVGNKTSSSGPPSPILDLTNVRRETWNRFFWYGLQNVFFDSYGLPLKASSRAYRQNSLDNRNAHVTQALAILSTYQNLRRRAHDESEFLAKRNEEGTPTPLIAIGISDSNTIPLFDLSPSFTESEMLELRARLLLSGQTFGGLFGPEKFHETVEKKTTKSLDFSGHNWELLRQQAEADGLYFEPLTMPDGTATHAILWISKNDLAEQGDRRFSGRFLNISNPWTDQKLKEWKGYSETRFFDDQNRRVSNGGADRRRVDLIPLAVYGLNHPKIPALLIDFRDSLNPKKREMSRRVMNDVARNILSLSSFGNLPYFAGRKLYGFLTGRRGMDVNQPSRVHSYSELKLLLAFNSTIDSQLRSELEQRLENVSLNPLSNDMASEIQLARQQYNALVEFARRDNGLSAKIERDRREEMVLLRHGPVTRFFFGLGNVLTFGRYVHREDATPELTERMELARRVQYHTQFLQQVAMSSPQIEVVWNMTEVRASLRFLADRGFGASGSAARAAALVFERSSETETRTLCLDVLSRINDKTARKEMLRIFRNQQPQSEWRAAVAERLRKAVAEDAHIKPADAKSVLTEVGQP
jgi:hypothetical protein